MAAEHLTAKSVDGCDAESHSSDAPASLVVFSDDWGRHPSSCQHLIRQLLPKYKVLWVNTIGTRAPRFDMATIKRITEKLKQWILPSRQKEDRADDVESHNNLTAVNPKMWPWFSGRSDRWLNAQLLQFQLSRLIRSLPQPVAAITTLPITADLTARLPVSQWLYYCVDDFSEWPGLDGNTLRRMDDDMIQRADRIVAVSEHLRTLIADRGRASSLLTHGVDLDHWHCPESDFAEVRRELIPDSGADAPLAVFWGVVDQRLDSPMLRELSRRLSGGHIVLVGPQQDPDTSVLQLPNVHAVGPRPFDSLPRIAQVADVLIMPYADLPVTRAMQPLKMKEYLATGRPVVVSNLPAVDPWRDCMDVSSSAANFAEFVTTRIQKGLAPEQSAARRRLKQEGWPSKAQQLEQHIIEAANL